MTAVDWMTKQLAENWNDENISLVDIYNKAKEMEKVQIIDAYAQCWIDNFIPPGNLSRSGIEYYNETFNK
jgi:hypothetical protein